MPKYEVSIIIPTFNERDRINSLVNRLKDSLLDCVHEIVVVDSNATTDGTLDSITCPDVIRIKSDKNSRAHQLRLGAKKAKHEILFFLHADTIPDKRFFKSICKSLDLGHDFGLFSYKFDKRSFFLDINSNFTKEDGLFTGGGDQGLFVRKTVYNQVGGYDRKLPIMEDFDLFWRLKRMGYRYALIPRDAIVSARKYEKNSYLKVQLVNLVTLLGFKWGYSPKGLKKFYNRMLST